MICGGLVSDSKGDYAHRHTYLRHGELETVIWNRVRRKDQCLEIQLLIAQNLPKSLPMMLLILLAIMSSLCAARGNVHELEETRFVRFQPASSPRRIG
jgi:hypothetical protein